jgi:hypothetical protein
MTGFSRMAGQRRSRFALTLMFGILLGISVEAASQQSAHRVLEIAAESASDVSLPDAPVPQQNAVSASQPVQAVQQPTPIPGNAPTLAQAPGLAQAVANGTIQGLITDRDGIPYQGVVVTLSRGNASPSGLTGVPSAVSIPVVQTETTDGQGRFQFRSIAPGPFQLSVASDGFATQIRSGALNSGENLEEAPIKLLMVSTKSEVQVTASQHDIAQAQMKQEEQQRVFGVIPNFYVVYSPNALPLSTGQKFHLAWRSSIDPVTFLITAVFAGVEQQEGDFKGYGQGASGYAKRFGAAYGDSVIGDVIGSAILPSLLKQDPRYFYKGTGTKKSRILHALESSFICRGDNGKQQFNYSGILGGLAGAGISNIYYPAADRNGAGLTFENTAIGIAGGSIQNLFQEFVVRHLTPKVPDYGNSKP